jgi:hypothetical protein
MVGGPTRPITTPPSGGPLWQMMPHQMMIFCWDGDKYGFNYGVAPTDNLPPIGCVPSSCMPSLKHSQVIPASSLPHTSSAVNQRARSYPTISRRLLSAI